MRNWPISDFSKKLIMSRLFGKRALITGGTTGIGLETARQFLAEGAQVAITGMNNANLAAAQRELGAAVLVIQSDAAKLEAQSELVKKLQERWGKLDAVFINAGVADFRPIERFDEEGFDQTIAVNTKGPFFLMQALIPILNNPASIICNTSISAHQGIPMSSAYAASKAALLSMVKTFSGELIGRGIRVNAISPGPVDTPIYTKMGMQADQIHQMKTQMGRQIPIRRLGTPVEIAKAVVFLASDESQFVVGSELIIDGGMINT
jgi:NAD(P)-dependent dehydrogenase (short-subunit alcohol dehydrogenase family)